MKVHLKVKKQQRGKQEKKKGKKKKNKQQNQQQTEQQTQQQQPVSSTAWLNKIKTIFTCQVLIHFKFFSSDLL